MLPLLLVHGGHGESSPGAVLSPRPQREGTGQDRAPFRFPDTSFVVKGHMRMLFRDKTVDVGRGEFLVVPHGVEHKPTFTEETHIMLIEPKATVNTGDADENDLTHGATEWIWGEGIRRPRG